MNKMLLLFSLIPFFAFSQENYNFLINNNQLEWQKIYESKMTKVEIENILKSNGMFKDLTIEENIIKGYVENIPPDYKGAGKSQMSTTFYVLNSTINTFFMIEFKEEKYRVSLNNINLRGINDFKVGNVVAMSANSLRPLSEFAIKNSKLRSHFLSADANTYNYSLSNLFDFGKYQIKTTEW